MQRQRANRRLEDVFVHSGGKYNTGAIETHLFSSVVFRVKLCNQCCLYVPASLVQIPWRHAFLLKRQCGTYFDYTLCAWLPAPLFLKSSYTIVTEGSEKSFFFFFILFPYVAFRSDLQVLVSLDPSAPLLCQSWPFSRLFPGRTLAPRPRFSPTGLAFWRSTVSHFDYSAICHERC